MIVICPSRGRPGRAAAMVASLREMAGGKVAIAIVIDIDDPKLLEYLPLHGRGTTVLVVANDRGFSGAVNMAAKAFWDRHDILGIVGDDVLFRTPAWDKRVLETLATPGLAYGDDLVHGERHPTAVFMSSTIAKALGWAALPSARHQWIDDAWKLLGQQLGALRYMPDVVMEHMHFAVGKSDMDATYAAILGDTPEANAIAAADHAAFMRWSKNEIEADLANVRAAIGVPA